MNNENNFETFLYYSNKKLSICVQQSDKDSKFYEKSVLLDENLIRLMVYQGFKQVDEMLGILLFFGNNQYKYYR